jgi:hypothetical protein
LPLASGRPRHLYDLRMKCSSAACNIMPQHPLELAQELWDR